VQWKKPSVKVIREEFAKAKSVKFLARNFVLLKNGKSSIFIGDLPEMVPDTVLSALNISLKEMPGLESDEKHRDGFVANEKNFLALAKILNKPVEVIHRESDCGDPTHHLFTTYPDGHITRTTT
jgi:hypothetical protein